MQQVSYEPFIMSIMLIMSCYTGFFNVWRGWQSLNTGPQFYLRQSSIKYDIIYNLLKRCKNIKHKDVSSFPVWCLFIITGQHDCLRVWQWGQGKVTSCGITYILKDVNVMVFANYGWMKKNGSYHKNKSAENIVDV